MTPTAVPVNEELDEFLNDLGLSIAINIERGCFYLCPEMEFDSQLSPCFPAQEDLEEWASDNAGEISKRLDIVRRRESDTGSLTQDYYETLPFRRQI